MEVQAIDHTISPSVLGKIKVYYCPRSLTSGIRTLWSSSIPRKFFFDLLPAFSFNNCIILNVGVITVKIKIYIKYWGYYGKNKNIY